MISDSVDGSDGPDERPPRDPLRRAAHVALLILLSPALILVLLVGGFAVLIEAIARPVAGSISSALRAFRSVGPIGPALVRPPAPALRDRSE